MIGYLDADCFYVSAERVRDPYLSGKPVGVLGNNGACVIAKSYEMKKAGVRTGEPIWDAVKLCPQGIYVKRDFRWYEVLSRCMLDIVRAASPRVEYYSIDEFAFHVPLDRSTAAGRGPAAEAFAADLRDEIKAKTGLPVTVSVARTRTLAKLFTDTAKPFGAVAVLDPDREAALLGRLPITEVAGIAGRRAARLASYGVRTCLDFVRLPRSTVKQLLTVVGERLWQELNGVSVLPLEPQKPLNQTVSRGGGFTATADPAFIYAWLVRHVERLIEELDYHELRAGKLTVWVTYKDHPAGLGEGLLDAQTNRFDLLLDAARGALRQAWRAGVPATRVDVVATKLCHPAAAQRSLFEPPGERQAAVAAVKRAVNAAVGRFTVRSGATLPLAEIYRDTAAGYDICDIRDKQCF